MDKETKKLEDQVSGKKTSVQVYSGADKREPMSGSSMTDRGSMTDHVRKEADEPGGLENAAGMSNESVQGSKIGSGPVPDEAINKGE